MNSKAKIVISAFIGFLGGIAAWPLIETSLHIQNKLSSIIIANAIFGVIIGALFGFFLGAIDGVLLKSGRKLRSGMFWGIILGALGGIFGSIGGRIIILKAGDFFFKLDSSFSKLLLLLVKGLGWAILGVFIGISSGVVLHSKGKIKQGALGGLIGGFLGGIFFEIIMGYNMNENIARFIGLGVMGLFIGLFLALAENVFSKGILKLLNGKLKGKEFELSYNRIKIGKSEKSDVGLFGFKKVASRHAEIKKLKDGFALYDAESNQGTVVNNQKVKKHRLNNGDIIEFGDAKVLFLAK